MALLVQLSNFEYVDRSKASLGKALRFTLALQMDIEADVKAELAIEGCMAFYKYTGAFIWVPPLSRFSMKRSYQIHWVNPPLYDLVRDALLDHPEFLKHLKTPVQVLLEKAGKVDPNLPQIIEITKENRDESN